MTCGCEFRNPRDKRFPPVVQIALVAGMCNARCRHCPQGRALWGDATPRECAELASVQLFPFDLFARIAAEIAEYPEVILRLHGRGEPMLHPRYLDMVECAKHAGVSVVTSFTNGISLDAHAAARLLEAPIDLLEVSADASNATDYLAWRRVDRFDQIVHNVARFVRQRAVASNHRTRLVVSAVGHEQFGEAQEQAFRAFWSPLADKVLVRPYHTYAGRIPALAPRLNCYQPCPQLWERFSISPEGLVNSCFNDWGNLEIVGDLRQPDTSIASIWRGVKFEHIRQAAALGPALQCCKDCSGPSISATGTGAYQCWVRNLIDAPSAGSRLTSDE